MDKSGVRGSEAASERGQSPDRCVPRRQSALGFVDVTGQPGLTSPSLLPANRSMAGLAGNRTGHDW